MVASVSQVTLSLASKKWPRPIPMLSNHKSQNNPELKKSVNLTRSTSRYDAFSGLPSSHESSWLHTWRSKTSTKKVHRIDSDPLPSIPSTSNHPTICLPDSQPSMAIQGSHSSGPLPVFSSSASSSAMPKISASNAASAASPASPLCSSFSWRRSFSSETSARRAKEASEDWKRRE